MKHAVVETYADGSRRVIFGDMPMGRKLQPPGPRCTEPHDFYVDSYAGVRKTYIDKVCKACSRRIPIQ